MARGLGVELAIVTVTHHPELKALAKQLRALPPEPCKIIVDNGSPDSAVNGLRSLVAQVSNASLVVNKENLGLSAALNQGVRMLRTLAPQARLALLLDQDSLPEPGSIEALGEAHDALVAQGHRVGAVGPQLRDVDTGLMHGFHQMTHWRWLRAFPPTTANQPVPVANLNGSGTLMRIEVFEQQGGLDEALFIDHVDTEWSFRLLAAGFGLWGVPQAVFTHRMGRRGLRFWMFGWRVWPERSALRHRYLFRNTLWLMRRPYVPRVWKAWAAVKVMLTAVLHGVFDRDRRAQLAGMWEGVREGWRLPRDVR